MRLVRRPRPVIPAEKGSFSDYAGKLDEAQVNELSNLIREYKQQTSIEVAVIIVDSLDDQSPREYAEGIGDTWGVGNAGRNNGIVLLWAPNERGYSLRIADGLSPDLSDHDAAQITQENLVPNFRRADYYSGLKQTLLATMQRLGYESWEDRLRMRAEADRARTEDRKFSITIIAALVFLALAGIAGGVFVYRSRERRDKLAEMLAAKISIDERLSAAEQNAPKIQQALNDFSKEVPEQDVSSLTTRLAGQPARIADTRRDAAQANFTDLELYDEVLRIKASAEDEAGLLRDVQIRIADIRNAKERSRQLIDQLSQQKFEISDVRDASKREEVDELLYSGRQTLETARQRSSMSVVDWILIQDLLNHSQDRVQKAAQISQADPYTPSLNSTFDSTPSFSTDSSAGVGSTDTFGGGGGFSGGTGSEGTY